MLTASACENVQIHSAYHCLLYKQPLHYSMQTVPLTVVNDLHVVTPLVNPEESPALAFLQYLSWLIAPFCMLSKLWAFFFSPLIVRDVSVAFFFTHLLCF